MFKRVKVNDEKGCSRFNLFYAPLPIHDFLIVLSFNPISKGLVFMKVIGGSVRGLDGNVDWGTETTESPDGRGTSSNMTECDGDSVNRVPLMLLDLWMVINEILP